MPAAKELSAAINFTREVQTIPNEKRNKRFKIIVLKYWLEELTNKNCLIQSNTQATGPKHAFYRKWIVLENKQISTRNFIMQKLI